MASAETKKPRTRTAQLAATIAAPMTAGPGAASVASVVMPEPVILPVDDLPIAAPPAAELIDDASPVTLEAPQANDNPTTAVSPPTPTPAVAAAPAQPEDKPMTETYTNAAEAMKNGAEQMKSTMHATSEQAMASGKATFDQVATKSREAIEHGMKSVDEMAGLARGNVEAMLASSRAAAQGIEAIAREVAEFSRKTFDETAAAARAMTTVKTPNELMALQNDFAKTQFDAAVAEMSKLSETMVKLMGEVFEPIQARAAVATDKMKAVVGTLGQ